MIQHILNYLNRNEYIVHWYGIFFNRIFFIRRLLYKHISSFKHYISWKVLDFGCGYKPYKNIFHDIENYYWVDYQTTKDFYNSADYYYDGKTIPFKDEYFDSFLCTEVLEHVFNIDEVLEELYRTLKLGWYGLITLPFARDEHEVPYDFGRYTYYGIQYVLQRHKFKIIHHVKSGSYISSLSQLFIMYYIKISFSKFSVLNLFNRVTIIPLLNLLCWIIIFVSPQNQDLYLNHVIVVQK